MLSSTCLYPWRVQTMIMTPTCHLRKLRDYLLDSELRHEGDRSMAWVAQCRPLSCPSRTDRRPEWIAHGDGSREKVKGREGVGTLSRARGSVIYDGNSWSFSWPVHAHTIV